MNLEYLAESFWTKVDVGEPDDCWLWKQSSGSHGYGQTWDGKTVLLAHRVAWTLTNGEITDGLTIDHICRVRRCCNPNHLRLMTNEENGALNGNKIKTHCKRGHAFDEENTYWDRRGHRTCRQCVRDLKRQRVSSAVGY